MTNVTHKFLSMCLFLFLTLYMFRAHCAHHQGRQTVSIQPLVTHSVLVAMSCAGWEWTPDDEHDVLETCRESKIKINIQKGICASRWSFTKNMKFVLHIKAIRKIHFIFKSRCTISVLFPTKCSLFHNFTSPCLNNTFFINHVLKFKNQPGQWKVNWLCYGAMCC